jgi:hypothetical protein
VSLRYGLDLKAPTTIPGDDGWRPVMAGHDTRRLFDLATEALLFMDAVQRSQPQLRMRVVSIDDSFTSRLRRLGD